MGDDPMISFKQKGGWKKTSKFLKKLGEGDYYQGLDAIAKEGVEALSEATPKATGKTAASWSYTIKRTKDKTYIYWSNSNVVDGVNVAMLIQNGHGTKEGVYIEGIDYINPAIKPIFDEISEKIWKEVEEHE